MRNSITITLFLLIISLPGMALCQDMKPEISLPLVYHIGKGSGQLTLIGVRHTADYLDPQIKTIVREWDLQKPDITFCEGGIWQLEPSLQAAVLYGGEGGLLRFLAERDTVPIMSLEMPDSLQVLELIKDYRVEEIKLYLVMEYIPQYFRMSQRGSFDMYVAKAIRSVNKIPGLDGYLRNIAELGESVRGLLPELGDWRRVDDRWTSPVDSLGYTNDIARKRSAMRDEYMSRLLLQTMMNEKKAIAVVGLSHVLKVEPVLRAQAE